MTLLGQSVQIVLTSVHGDTHSTLEPLMNHSEDQRRASEVSGVTRISPEKTSAHILVTHSCPTCVLPALVNDTYKVVASLGPRTSGVVSIRDW